MTGPRTTPRPVAMRTSPDAGERFGWMLTGDTELLDANGQDQRDLAVTLARTFGVRALFDDTARPDRVARSVKTVTSSASHFGR